MKGVFRAAEFAANLVAQPRKCVIIFVSRPCDARTVELVRDFPAAHSPEWRTLQIDGKGAYPGVVVGFAAALSGWLPTVAKLMHRVSAIASGKHSLAAGAALYSRSSVPMMYPLGQVRLLAHADVRLDLRLPARVPMPTSVLMRLHELGAPEVPSILAMMIASFVCFASALQTDVDGALVCFAERPGDLPLSWRRFDLPPHWAGECMAATMKLILEGDFSDWPRRLRPDVHDTVRDSLAAGKPRGVQFAAYSAAHAVLFALDIRALVRERLARQLSIPVDPPAVAEVLRDPRLFDPRGALLIVRGATNAVCTGSRLQAPGSLCPFCYVAPDSLKHMATCQRALRVFFGALGRPPAASVAADLDGDLPHAARIWAAYVDFVSVVTASQDEVVSRGFAFLDVVAGALVRANLRPSEDDSAPRRRARRPRPAVGAAPSHIHRCGSHDRDRGNMQKQIVELDRGRTQLQNGFALVSSM